MNKGELVTSVASKVNITKRVAEACIETFVESIQEELAKGGKVQIIGFGTLEVRARKARIGRKPQSGGAIDKEFSTVANARGNPLNNLVFILSLIHI